MLDDITKKAYDIAKHKLTGAGYPTRMLDDDIIAENNGKYALAVDIHDGRRFSTLGIKQIMKVVANDFELKGSVISGEDCYLMGFERYSMAEKALHLLGTGCDYIIDVFSRTCGGY